MTIGTETGIGTATATSRAGAIPTRATFAIAPPGAKFRSPGRGGEIHGVCLTASRRGLAGGPRKFLTAEFS